MTESTSDTQAKTRQVAQAISFCAELAEQAVIHRVSPALIRSFQQSLAPLSEFLLKQPGLSTVGRSVAELERKLREQPVVESARRPEWIPGAQALLLVAEQRIKLAARRELYPEPPPDPLVRGLCVLATRDGQVTRLWFPLSCLTQVLKPDEIRTQSLRVVGEASESAMGLRIRASVGEAVLLVREVLEVLAWSKASQIGAQPGLDVFEEFLTQ